MLIADPKLFRSIFILSLAFLLLGLLDIHPAIEIGLFVLLMLGTGIPHGATDHLIYSILQKEEGKPQNWRMFLGTYLLSMLVYGLAWWLVPGLCLSIFLVISAYHFGQSQVLYVRWKPSDWRKRILGFAWGSLILSSLLLMHLEEVVEILSSIIAVPTGIAQLSEAARWNICGSLFAIVAGCWLAAWRSNALSTEEMLREILTLSVLFLAFALCGLWLGFALYFGLWHSLSSMKAEIQHFQAERSYSWRAFMQDAMPFSLISFGGIGILGLCAWWLGDQLPLSLVFFIAISTVTLPHTFYMERFYLHFPPHQLGREITGE
ncbi:MAG: Brp/Blh family beta-carotene 15,15'-dioxygenase [Bacteroidia bacterium]|nr:Brp/Blh family beta-carotene 15,15'-dioxygenase [Bacteroidia bacterium]